MRTVLNKSVSSFSDVASSIQRERERESWSQESPGDENDIQKVVQSEDRLL